MCKDMLTGECYRADKLLEDHIENMMQDATMPSAERVSVCCVCAMCEHCVSRTHRKRTPQERLRKIAAQADAFSPEQLGQQLKEMGIKATATGNDLSDPFPFNLMFATHIGPSGDKPGPRRPPSPSGCCSAVLPSAYCCHFRFPSLRDHATTGFLRPETAQGIFVNFKNLYNYNGSRMPFAAAQIGLAYRNEIAPRNGLLR